MMCQKLIYINSDLKSKDPMATFVKDTIYCARNVFSLLSVTVSIHSICSLNKAIHPNIVTAILLLRFHFLCLDYGWLIFQKFVS